MMTDTGTCGMLFKQISSELAKNANNNLRQDDLTISQISVLMMLRDTADGQARLKEVERSLHVAQSTAAGIVKRLEQKKFVECFTGPDDRRVKMVRITQLGLDCCGKADDNMKEADDGLTRALTETEKEILISLLRKVRDSF